MKGWGPASISAGLLFPYHLKVEQKIEITSNQNSGVSILNSFTKKSLWRKKHQYHHYYHHCHHHRHHYLCHHHQFHHHNHSLSTPPGANPAWGPLGWRKHTIIIIFIIKINIIIIIIIVIIIITIVIVFLPPSDADCVKGPLGVRSATSLPQGWSHFNIKLIFSPEGCLPY